MKPNPFFKILLIALVLGLAGNATAQEQPRVKQAQAGFEFLSVVSDARATAMALAVNSLEMGSSSLFFNPAGMANMSSVFDVSASYNKWIADIQHNTFSLAINPMQGRFGVFGFTVQTVDYGDKFYGAIVDQSTGGAGYIETGTIEPSAYAVGVGYAKALSDRFSVGGQVRYVKQDFGDLYVPQTDSTTTKARYELSPLAFDFGTIFKTGFQGLTFGMSVRNFSKEIKYEEEGFQLPLEFVLGIHTDLIDVLDLGGPQQSCVLSVNASHPRSRPEQMHFGIDYKLMNALSLRMGYVTNSDNDENNISYGLGLSLVGLSIDYAYTPFATFDNVQRFTARFSFKGI